jgi:hypothetical protein
MRLPFLQFLSVVLEICQSAFPLIKDRGMDILKAMLPEIKTGKNKMSPELLHQLLYVLRTNMNIHPSQKHSILQSVQSAYPDVDSSSLLAPMLQGLDISDMKSDSGKKDESILSSFKKKIHPVDFLIDIGYSAMVSIARFRELLKSIPSFSEKDVAAMIAFMIRSHTGYFSDQASLAGLSVHKTLSMTSSKAWSSFDSAEKDNSIASWNIDVFIKVLNEFVSAFSNILMC